MADENDNDNSVPEASPSPPPKPPTPSLLPPPLAPKVASPHSTRQSPPAARPKPAAAHHDSAKTGGIFFGCLCSILTNFGYLIWLVLVLLEVLIILIFALFLVLVNTDLGDMLAAVKPPCVTKECVEASSGILGKMNLSGDPCTDMYHYACGSHDNRLILGVEDTSVSILDSIGKQIKQEVHKLLETTDTKVEGKVSTALTKAKIYYDTCMDRFKIRSQSLSKLQMLINENDSWNLTTHGLKPWDPDTWSLQESLTKMHKLDTGVLFDTVVRPNFKDTNSYMIMLLPARYTAKGVLLESTAGIDTLVAATVDTVQGFSGDDEVDQEKIEAMYEFERKLHQLTLKENPMTNQSIHKMGNVTSTTVEKLQVVFGSMIDLRAYLKDLFGGSKDIGTGTEILAGSTAFYESLEKLIAETEKEVLANYLMWHLITQHMEYISEELIQPFLWTITRGDGMTSLSPVKARCFAQTEQVFGFALGTLYVKDYVKPDLKETVMKIFKEIKKHFMNSLKGQEWLDFDSRQKVSRKAEIMFVNLGYPDWMMDATKLDEFYKQFNIRDNEYLYNYISAKSALKQLKLEKFFKPVDRTEWDMDVSPYGVVAYYDPQWNGITVPAGVFRAPLYVPSVTEAYSFGSVGSILGRELIHGFDTTTVTYDEHGKLNEIFTAEIKKRFDSCTSCLVDQYDKYKINGKLTLDANIADVSGIRYTYKAYKSTFKATEYKISGINFTHDQLFFIGFAQSYCTKMKPEKVSNVLINGPEALPKHRIFGTLSNFPEFAKAFKCSSKKVMNPLERCVVW